MAQERKLGRRWLMKVAAGGVAAAATGATVKVAGAAPQRGAAVPRGAKTFKRLPPKVLKRFKLSRSRIKAGRIPPTKGVVQIAGVAVSATGAKGDLALLHVVPPGHGITVTATVRSLDRGAQSIPWRVRSNGKAVGGRRSLATSGGRQVDAVATLPAGKAGTRTVTVTIDSPWAEARGAQGDNEVEVPVVVDPWGTWAVDFLDAVTRAVQSWRERITFVGVMIQGPSVIGNPGCMRGADLEPFIVASLRTKGADAIPAATGRDLAKGYAECFKKWQEGVQIPGFALFPHFAAQPVGPVAPTPSTPVPLASLHNQNGGFVQQASVIEATLLSKLGSKASSDAAKAAVRDISTILAVRFYRWLNLCRLEGLLGYGNAVNPNPASWGIVVGEVVPSPGRYIVGPKLDALA